MRDEGLADLLARQSGVVSRRQLEALGYRPHDTKRMLRRRLLARVHPGVFVEHTGPLTGEQRAWAAVLALWPAALCAESAIHDGPVAGSDFAAFTVLAEACRTRRTTPRRLADALAGRARLPRRAWLAAVLADLAAGTASVLEHRYATAVERAHGLPTARRQVRATTSTGVVYRDAEYAGELVVELDGRLVHNTVAQRDADFERDLDAALNGRTTIRLSWGQVVGRPCHTAAKLAQLLRRRGWPNRPHPCHPACPIGVLSGDRGPPGGPEAPVTITRQGSHHER